MFINNEIGTIQKIPEISKIIKNKNPKTLLHVDAVQGFGKHRFNIKDIDLLSFSAHKIHAPKGVGGLYIKKGTKINAQVFGGDQQSGLRPGTENTSAIVGMGIACKLAYEGLEANLIKVKKVKDKLLEITQRLEGVYINGDYENSTPYILNLSFEGIKAETLVHALENEDIFVSTGAACSSKNKKHTSVVGTIDKDRSESSVRFSFSEKNTVEEAQEVVNALERHVEMLRRYKRR